MVKEKKEVKPVVNKLETVAKPPVVLQTKEPTVEIKKTNVQTNATPEVNKKEAKVVKPKSTKIKTTKPKTTATAKTTKTKTKRTSSYKTKKTKQANDQVI